MPKHAAGKSQSDIDVIEILERSKQEIMTGEGND